MASIQIQSFSFVAVNYRRAAAIGLKNNSLLIEYTGERSRKMSGNNAKILVVEPYYGGSHRQFLEGLQHHVEADYTLLSLPARKWKMRMQLGAAWMAEQLASRPVKSRFYDTVLVSSFLDLSLLKNLLQSLPGWNSKARFHLYFHENQFAYPSRSNDPAFFQFSAMNLTSALAADKIAFNTRFNRDSFIAGYRSLLKKAADMHFHILPERLEKKISLLNPGLDFTTIDEHRRRDKLSLPVIVWNHRWEHDKDPETFFSCLKTVKDKGVDFRLIVLGQSFASIPACFHEAKRIFSENILHFGYAPSADEYAAWLRRGDLVVSTAIHEFFGIAVIEAVRAGCRPLLPNRLAYPELFEAEFLYEKDGLGKALTAFCRDGARLDHEKSLALTSRFSWDHLKENYRNWLLR